MKNVKSVVAICLAVTLTVLGIAAGITYIGITYQAEKTERITKCVDAGGTWVDMQQDCLVLINR